MSIPASDRGLQSLLQDHARLRQRIGNIRESMARRRTSPHELAAALEDLKDQIRKHFAEEEASGFFSVVIDRWPQAEMRVDRLVAQHREFIDDAAACMSLALRGDDSAAWWTELEREFEEFASRLEQHEHEENALLLDISESELDD